MEKIILNFYDEKEEIDIPSSLDLLKKIISGQFLFSESDVDEIIIEYIKDLKKIQIHNEEDFKLFLKEGINELFLDISEESKLYKDNLNAIVNNIESESEDEDKIEKEKKDKTEYEKKLEEELIDLMKEKKNLIEKSDRELKEGKEKLSELSKKIQELKNEYNNIENDINKKYKKNCEEIIKKEQRINEIKTLLKIPIKKGNKMNQFIKIKKELKKEKHQLKKEEKIQKKLLKESKEKEREKKKKEKKEKEKKEKKKEKAKGKKNSEKEELNPEKNDYLNDIIDNFNDKRSDIVENPINIIPIGLELLSNILINNNDNYQKNNYNNDNYSKNNENKNNNINPLYCVGCGNLIKGENFRCNICEEFSICKNCNEIYGKNHEHDLIKYDN